MIVWHDTKTAVNTVRTFKRYGIQYGASILNAMCKFLLVFAPTQVPLAIIEGILTVLIIMALETYAKPELRAIGFMKEAK